MCCTHIKKGACARPTSSDTKSPKRSRAKTQSSRMIRSSIHSWCCRNILPKPKVRQLVSCLKFHRNIQNSKRIRYTCSTVLPTSFPPPAPWDLRISLRPVPAPWRTCEQTHAIQFDIQFALIIIRCKNLLELKLLVCRYVQLCYNS